MTIFDKVIKEKILLSFMALLPCVLCGLYYIYIDLIRTTSLRSTLFILYAVILIMIFIFFIMNRKNAFNKINAQSWIVNTATLNLFNIIFTFIICSVLFRLYSYFVLPEASNLKYILARGVLFDVNTIRYLVPLLAMLYLGYFFTFLFVKNSTLKILHILNLSGKAILLVLIFIMAYLYGWVPDVKKFVGIEVYYLRQIEGINYHYEYFLMGLLVFFIPQAINIYYAKKKIAL